MYLFLPLLCSLEYVYLEVFLKSVMTMTVRNHKAHILNKYFFYFIDLKNIIQ